MGLARIRFDLATNKTLAMAGGWRRWIGSTWLQPTPVSNLSDCSFGRPCGKDPRHNPKSLLAVLRWHLYSQEEVDMLDFVGSFLTRRNSGAVGMPHWLRPRLCRLVTAKAGGVLCVDKDGHIVRHDARHLAWAIATRCGHFS
jgi:hypothetical protein